MERYARPNFQNPSSLLDAPYPIQTHQAQREDHHIYDLSPWVAQIAFGSGKRYGVTHVRFRDPFSIRHEIIGHNAEAKRRKVLGKGCIPTSEVRDDSRFGRVSRGNGGGKDYGRVLRPRYYLIAETRMILGTRPSTESGG